MPRPTSTLITAIAATALLAVISDTDSARADVSTGIQRLGRLWGVGWGDGYHSCTDSCCRPLQDLPPLTYAQSMRKQACLVDESCDCGCSDCDQSGCDTYRTDYDWSYPPVPAYPSMDPWIENPSAIDQPNSQPVWESPDAIQEIPVEQEANPESNDDLTFAPPAQLEPSLQAARLPAIEVCSGDAVTNMQSPKRLPPLSDDRPTWSDQPETSPAESWSSHRAPRQATMRAERLPLVR